MYSLCVCVYIYIPWILQAKTLKQVACPALHADCLPTEPPGKPQRSTEAPPCCIGTQSSEAGNGNSLQYSCLEKFTDRGTCRATANGVPKSRT